MFERIQNDGVGPKTATVGAQARADLAVSPAPASSELREKAVAPAANGQKPSAEQDTTDQAVHLLGQVRHEVDAISAADQSTKKLYELYSKLFKAYDAAKQGPLSAEMKTEIDRTLDELDKHDAVHLLGQGDGPVDVSEESAADLALRQQRERTIDKIANALRKVGVLRNKLSDSSQSAHERLLNINSSLSGLNIARSQVDENQFSIENASSTVDSVMLNLRSLVLAHGKISSDVVRIVMS
jgi:hypothetical protein